MELAAWIKPTAEEVHARRQQKGCGLMTAHQQLIHERVEARLPQIIADKDFVALTEVVVYLLSRNPPPTY